MCLDKAGGKVLYKLLCIKREQLRICFIPVKTLEGMTAKSSFFWILNSFVSFYVWRLMAGCILHNTPISHLNFAIFFLCQISYQATSI